MEPDRAIEIVQSLSDGVDPFSGEQFPYSSPYQQADTVRALHLALEGLGKLKRSTARKTGSGRPWTDDEEKERLREFYDKIDVEEIAAKHERTQGATWSARKTRTHSAQGLSRFDTTPSTIRSYARTGTTDRQPAATRS